MGPGTNKRYNGGNLEESMEKLWCTKRFTERQPRTESPRFRTFKGAMGNTKQSMNGTRKMYIPNAQIGKHRIPPL
jgi:hypothetical protein